jgi:peptide/nickel transport system substrate-binding protein
VRVERRWKRFASTLVASLLSGSVCCQVTTTSALASEFAKVPAMTPAAATTTPRPGESYLVIEPRTETSLTDNFNPFDTASPLTQMGVPSYIYEPLVQDDELQVDQYYPWLAESWSFSMSGQTITFDLRPRVRFDDGSFLTAADVAYTFDLLKDNPTINDGLPIVSAVATNPTTFTLTLKRAAYPYLYNISRVPIVKAGFAAGTNPVDYVDKQPDGTGPYALAEPSNFTDKLVVLTAHRGYWQAGLPEINQLKFPAFPDSAAVTTALRAGTLDWAASYLPDVETSYVQKDPTNNHYWFPPVNCVALELNLAEYPTDNLSLRQAISDAIDRDALSQQTNGGFDPPATTTSGLVLPTDGQFLSEASSNDIEKDGDTAAATLLMLGAGFHLSAAGYWANASGRVARLNIVDPVGTSLADVASVVAEQLRSAGFDASAGVVPASRWLSDLALGHFTGSVLSSASGPTPYYMYESWLDPALIAHGRADGGDYVRLDSATDPSVAATVTDDLDDFADSPTGSATAQVAAQALGDVVSQEMPVVALLYGVAWGEFSTRRAEGWPSADDPYEPPVPEAPFAEYTVLQLEPSPS